MITTEHILVALLVLLIGVELITATTRSSLRYLTPARLLSQGDQLSDRSRRVLNLLHSRQRIESAFHLTLLLARFLSAGLILALFAPQAWTILATLLSLGILLLAALLVFLAEEMVEGLVSRNPLRWADRLAPFANGLVVVLSPVLAVALAMHHTNGEAEESEAIVTEDELKTMLDASHQEGVLEGDEREMIYSIFQLGDTLAREVMVPRIYITALDSAIPLDQAADALLASGYSRLPVYEETIDNILGVLYARDLLRAWREGGQVKSLGELLRPAYFVPEAKKVDELLDEMQARRVHMAIVVDEYGGVAGLVTMEDIVEEIVGDIRDEFDLTEEAPYQQVGVDEYVMQGRLNLDDFNELMDSSLPSEEAETIGGLMYSRIGHVPVTGESIELDGLLLSVEQVSGRRIRKVRAKKQPLVNPQDQEAED